MSVLLRVTQLNAIYLDKEILKCFQQILHNSMNYLPPSFVASYGHELDFLLQLAVMNYSIMQTGATFGQQLLSIRYEEITTLKKCFYIIFNSLGYFKTKFEYWQPSSNINDIIQKIFYAVKLLDLINFTLFLCKGTKPLLIERLLGLEQVYADGSKSRTFNSKYLARELLWNSCIEIMVHVVPLINFHRCKRVLRNLNPFNQKRQAVSLFKASMTIHSKCAYCQKTPILPHHMGCHHVFCYYCLRGNLEADPKFSCPMCDHWNENVLCERVTSQG